MKAPKTMMEVQDQYVETVNLGTARWSHRRDGGHTSRIFAGARRKAEKQLRKLGFTNQRQIEQIIKDARDMASLERIASPDIEG